MFSPSRFSQRRSSIAPPRMGRNAPPMRIALAVFMVAVWPLISPVCGAQPPANGAPALDAAPAPLPVSGSLKPSLDNVQRTLDGLRLEKWKRGSVREEANNNIGEIVRDLATNLPGLLQEADAAPGSLSKVLPLSRHVNALYDVLLRVAEAARVAAPDDQAAQLQQALIGLGNARLALEDRMQGSADALEKQVTDLHNALRTQAARNSAPVPAALPCVPATTHRTTTKTRKPAAGTPAKKPAAATPATANSPTNTSK